MPDNKTKMNEFFPTPNDTIIERAMKWLKRNSVCGAASASNKAPISGEDTSCENE